MTMLTPADPWPQGLRPLSQEEAAQIIRDGTHAMALEHGQNLEFDAHLLNGIADGDAVFALNPENRLVWQRSLKYMDERGYAKINHVWTRLVAL